MTSPVSPITQQGKVVGTVQYMSPEQIEGREADARSDIFALGCVLYEMATGKRAFEGKSNLSIASAILEKEPEPVSTVQPLTPPALDHVIQRALAKSPDDRWQSAADVRGELQWISSSSGQISAQRSVSQKKRWLQFIPWAVAALALVGLLLALWRSPQSQAPPLLRTTIMPPGEGAFVFYGDIGSEPVISPDGTALAVAASANNVRGIYIRELNSETARVLPGSEGGSFPFWSPDSKQLGYVAGGRLVRADIASGSTTTIANVGTPRGASWSKDGTILFTPTFRSPIYAVPVRGGEPRQVTQIDGTQHTSHRWPFFLPDGEHFLYLAVNHRTPTSDHNGLFVASVNGGPAKRLVGTLCNVAVVESRLVFCRDNRLYIQDFDLRAFELRGEPQLLVSSVLTDISTWRAMFSIHARGLLLYAPSAPKQGSELVWFDRNGKRLGRFGDLRDYLVIAISRNGKKIAAEVEATGSSIWVGDVGRNTLSRFTFEGTSARQPVLSPDGTQVAYSIDVGSKVQIVRTATSGLGTEEKLTSSDIEASVNDWSPDGRYLILQQGQAGQQEYALVALQLFGERKLIPIFRVPHQLAYDGTFSPDMKWISYTLPENGREEIFVSPFDPNVDPNTPVVRPAGRRQISNGGALARWSHDGRKIFYLASEGKLMSVDVQATANSFDASPPQELFPVSYRSIIGPPYAVMPDGRFLVNNSLEPLRAPLNLVSDWHQLLKP
jgi:Tol biopolymer transport system component